jgi:hypothetical protein
MHASLVAPTEINLVTGFGAHWLVAALFFGRSHWGCLQPKLFDQNEQFIKHIYEDWQSRKIQRKYPVWNLIRSIRQADMRETIPLQIADVAAWSRNRIESKDPNDMGPIACLAYRFTNATLFWEHREVGQKAMAESTFPEEGAARERLFKPPKHRFN